MLRKYILTGEKIVETSAEEATIFVYVLPDESERKYLINDLKLDEHTLSSSLDPDELSRLEFEPDHAAMIYKRPENLIDKDQLLFKVTSAGLFLFNGKIILIMNDDTSLFDTKIFSKVKSLQHLALKLILRSITHFLEHLKAINTISEELEKKINESMENKYLLNLFTLEKSLVYYLNAINTNGTLLERLKNNAAKLGLSTLESELLDDIYIENNQCYRQAEIYSNILASMMDARASIVSNNLNILMKTLNIITIGIMVPTFVVSAFSMNVGIPLQKHPYAFWIVMMLAFISVAGFYFFWKRKKW